MIDQDFSYAFTFVFAVPFIWNAPPLEDTVAGDLSEGHLLVGPSFNTLSTSVTLFPPLLRLFNTVNFFFNPSLLFTCLVLNACLRQ